MSYDQMDIYPTFAHIEYANPISDDDKMDEDTNEVSFSSISSFSSSTETLIGDDNHTVHSHPGLTGAYPHAPTYSHGYGHGSTPLNPDFFSPYTAASSSSSLDDKIRAICAIYHIGLVDVTYELYRSKATGQTYIYVRVLVQRLPSEPGVEEAIKEGTECLLAQCGYGDCCVALTDAMTGGFGAGVQVGGGVGVGQESRRSYPAASVSAPPSLPAPGDVRISHLWGRIMDVIQEDAGDSASVRVRRVSDQDGHRVVVSSQLTGQEITLSVDF